MNKAFLRSIEVVMAIILFFSFYSIRIQSYETESELSSPVKETNSLLMSLEKIGALSEYADSYDLTGMSELLAYHLSPLIGFKLELDYLETVTAKNNNGYSAEANMSFLKFFPKNTNTLSVIISDEDGKFLPTSIINNYYEVEISIPVTAELVNATILLENVSISVKESESINTSSMHAFLDNEPALMSLESINYTAEPYDANVSVKVLVPYAKKDSIIKATLFYSSNTTGFIQDYPILASATPVSYYSSKPSVSRTCEVIFTDTLNEFEEKRYNLYYELNSETANNYTALKVNQSNIEIFYDNSYYQNNENFKTFQAVNAYSVKTELVSADKICAINMKVWNYE